MKRKVLAFLLCASITTSALAFPEWHFDGFPPIPSPGDTISLKDCYGYEGYVGYAMNSTNPSLYYFCNGITMTVYPQACPGDTVFNPLEQTCTSNRSFLDSYYPSFSW